MFRKILAIQQDISLDGSISKNDHKDPIMHVLMDLYVTAISEKQLKYVTFLKILQNQFLSERYKELIIAEFGRAQRVYITLCRFAFLYKFKKAQMPINIDLFLNVIDDTKNYIVTLYQEKTKYLFTISDLLRIIQSALFNSPYKLECEPIAPKNPYNNTQFSYAHFFHLYYHLKTKCMYTKIPLFFQLFFESNFKLKDFLIRNEIFIQKNVIKQYIFSVTTRDTEVMMNLKCMLSDNKNTRRLQIDPNFPKDELLDIFRPYLYLYYLIWYSDCYDAENSFYKSYLALLLNKFFFDNPRFGIMEVLFEKVYDPDPDGVSKIVSYHSFLDYSDDRPDGKLQIISTEDIERLNKNAFVWKDSPFKIVRKMVFNKTHTHCDTQSF